MKDPLDGTAPLGAHELFNQITKLAHGFSHEDVAVAAVNVLINAVRQNRAKRDDAAALYDGFVAKGRHVLLEEHYDASGRRKGVYPYHQVLSPEPIVNLSKVRGT